MTYQAFAEDGSPLGDEVTGCLTEPPTEHCTFKVNDTYYPPGTQFKVKVYSEKDGVKSDPMETTTNTRKFQVFDIKTRRRRLNFQCQKCV